MKSFEIKKWFNFALQAIKKITNKIFDNMLTSITNLLPSGLKALKICLLSGLMSVFFISSTKAQVDSYYGVVDKGLVKDFKAKLLVQLNVRLPNNTGEYGLDWGFVGPYDASGQTYLRDCALCMWKYDDAINVAKDNMYKFSEQDYRVILID